MTVYVAFYKGKAKPGSPLRERMKYLFDGAIRLFTRSPYSHCEFAIPDPNREGVYFCVSASARDDAGTHGKRRSIFPWDRGGVRGKYMQLPPDRWDLLRSDLTEDAVRSLLRYRQGQGYDWTGILRFLIPIVPHMKNRWFCSELVGSALTLRDAHRLTPQDIYDYLRQQPFATVTRQTP